MSTSLQKTGYFNTKSALRIASIDDHPLVLEGIRQILRQAGHEIVQYFPINIRPIDWLTTQRVDLVTIDIGMPGLNGIELCRQIHALSPNVSIIIVTQQTDRAYVRAAFQAGALGFVSKQAAGTDLLAAIAAVGKGRIYISPQVINNSEGSEDLLGKLLGEKDELLTARQQKVLQHIADGLTMKEIAQSMEISVKTVEFHKRALVEALGISTTAELTKYAIAHGQTFLPS